MIEKFIKTECGLSEYKRLKILSEDRVLFKIRLYVFVIIAIMRDLFK